MLNGLPPVWRPDGRLLILGSFPGAASLQAAQYYAHPRNAFWPLMAALLNTPALPQQPYAERLRALTEHGIALWDAVAACERQGSLDSAIRDAQPSDLPGLVASLPRLQALACNGGAAFTQAQRLLPGRELIRLPSSSPAHAGLSFEAKRSAWVQACQRFLGDSGVSGTG